MNTPRRQTELIRRRLEQIEDAPATTQPMGFLMSFAMLAKEAIFKAQDELQRLEHDPRRPMIEAMLSHVRTELEAIDRARRSQEPLPNNDFPAELFYVLDAREVVGNCCSWWRPHGKGYTCEIREAGLYTAEEMEGSRETDVLVPRDVVERLRCTHVRMDHLREHVELPRLARGRRR